MPEGSQLSSQMPEAHLGEISLIQEVFSTTTLRRISMF